jgi:alkanesulfonate monooxygenase SsuD/methylene tetrahydromethanopterin reductase-like flavin-dependent oxidoreductase (luciferase family)
MRLGFGLLTCQRHPSDPERRSDAVLYQQALELAELADETGLDSCWVSEHHFVDDAYMPSTFAVLAAAAARTKRIQLGSAVLLAPLSHPLRIAEDAATVDLLSEGRLILGLGLGWREEELIGFGIAGRHRGRMLEEIVATLRDAWAADRLAGTAQVAVFPKPFRAGGPPIWIGAMSEAALRRTARIGDGFLAVSGTREELAEQVRILRALNPRITTSAIVSVFVWDGPEDPWELAGPYVWYRLWKYTDMRGARARRGAPPLPPALDEARARALRQRILLGRPEEVLEKLKGYHDLIGDDGHLVASAYYPGLPWSVQRHEVKLLGELARKLKAGA